MTVSHSKSRKGIPNSKSQPTRRSATGKKQITPRPSPALIEQTRKLMEATIDFVPSPRFRRTDFAKKLCFERPASLDERHDGAGTEPGLAFVTGLVQSPLLSSQEEKYLFTWMNFLKFRAERYRRLLDLNCPDPSLIERIQADLDEALRVRNQIVAGNLRLVVSLARKITASVDQMSELISEGMMPLIRSVELFDIELGNRFSTYATWAVRNQMLRWLKRVRSSRESVPSEDAPSLENLPDKQISSEVTEPEFQQRIQTVHQLLSSLSERERAAVTARFGLDGQPHGQSLALIAERMGLSKERVRQIVIQSLSKLKSGIDGNEC